jgi:CheY-like chemotaxis protein
MATILIVEDEPQISALVRSLIEEQGHKVLSAAAADEALGILNGPEAVDALFVDIILKGDMQAGIEFAKRAVELKPDLKVLYSTGLTVTDDMKALVVPWSIILEKLYSGSAFNELIASPWGRAAVLRFEIKVFQLTDAHRAGLSKLKGTNRVLFSRPGNLYCSIR